MAVSRREYIFAAFLVSLLCVILIIVSISTDRWVASEGEIDTPINFGTSQVNYGLFMGEQILWQVATPNESPLHMTCVFEVGACAMSCKTTYEARRDEVIALANGQTPNLICASATIIDDSVPLREPSVISSAFYVVLLLVLFLHLVTAFVAACLAIFNATKNPTEPLLGVPGVRWCNVICAVLGLAVLVMWGVYWSVTGLSEHLALAYVFAGELIPLGPYLGFSYWVLLGSTLCAILNVALVEARRWHLEREPPPPTITIDNHSDGTIFLY